MPSVVNDGASGKVQAIGADNGIEIDGSATGSPVTVKPTAASTDTDVGLDLLAKGAGKIGLGAASADSRFTKLKYVTLAVDPPNLGAQTAARVPLTFPASTFTAAAFVIPIPPTTLEADLIPMGFVVTGANAGDLGVHSVGAVNGASLTWSFLIFEP